MNNFSDSLAHIGVARKSGRYPWGSGKMPFQRSGDFLSRIEELKKAGAEYVDPDTGQVYKGDTAIAKIVGLTTTQFRTQKALAADERREVLVSTAKGLRDKGYSLNAIAKEMGYKNDSSVRSLLNEDTAAKKRAVQNTVDFLKNEVDTKGNIDVGAYVETHIGISKERLNQALYVLEREGYPTYLGGVPQLTNPGQQTNLKVLCPPGTKHSDIFAFTKGDLNISSIEGVTTHDGGATMEPKWVYPKSLDSKRVMVRYVEDGGGTKDGLVELRRNVDDISLGESKYAQVRILVDNDRYIKGMAAYTDDIPDGYDLVFNTNKNKSVAKQDVFKKITDDPDNPFGATIKSGIDDPTNPSSDSYKGGQSYYIDKTGTKQLSVINKKSVEGDWTEWQDKLPSQFLAKQNISLINKQLDLALKDKQSEFDEIMTITNPTVKKKLLESFASDCDSASVHLAAASLPRQKYHVILPITDMKDNEVFAPQYKNGEQVALVRYPHGGTFEIPVLTVNNKKTSAKKMIGDESIDAIGINAKVAEQLSGADFDGDTVMVIPTNSRVNITATKPLSELKGFDAKVQYAEVPGMTYMKYETVDKNGNKKIVDNTQKQMGMVSNLITDMTVKGASPEELSRAVKHSMTVIDAGKHKLNYKQSEIDNGIKSLKNVYQKRTEYLEDGTSIVKTGGASTILSSAKSEVQIVKRQGSPRINKKDTDYYNPDLPEGALMYKTNSTTYLDKKTGEQKYRTQASTKMAETPDAHSLVSSPTSAKEKAYADYANSLKKMANDARKEMVYAPKQKYDPDANKMYTEEVKSLNSQLTNALKNKPRERQALIIAASSVAAQKQSNPSMSKEEIKKASQRATTKARTQTGSQRELINISDKEWEAIQAGAISENTLTKILNNADIDVVRKLATPKTTTTLSPSKLTKIKTMQASGKYSLSEMAAAIGVSTATVKEQLNL